MEVRAMAHWRRRLPLNLGAAALAGMILLTACGGGATPTQSTAAGGTTTISATAPAASKAAKSILTISQGVDAETLDPQNSLTQATLNITQQINEPLLEWDYNNNKFIPLLATSWKQVDPTTWEFDLRPNVTFTNGEALTAETVVWNVQRLIDPANKLSVFGLLPQLSGAKAAGPLTVDITTSTPFPLLPLGLTRFQIIPDQYFQKVGLQGFLQHPIGTGPYEFVSWSKDNQLVLDANPNYWGGKPTIDELVFKPIPDAATRMAALQNNEVDLVTNIDFNDVPALKGDSNVNVVSGNSLRLMGIYLDSRPNSPLADARVRQALNYAVNTPEIISKLLLGYGKPLQGQVLSPEYNGFNPAVKAYPYDPAKAKQLLQEAGFKQTAPFVMDVGQGRYPKGQETGQAVAGMLAQVGVQVNVQTIPWANFISKLMSKQLPPMSVLAYSTQPDAYFQLQLYECNYRASLFCNTTFDGLVNQAIQTADPGARVKLYQQAAAITHDDPPIIYLYQMADLYAVNKRVQGWKPSADERLDWTGVTVSH